MNLAMIRIIYRFSAVASILDAALLYAQDTISMASNTTYASPGSVISVAVVRTNASSSRVSAQFNTSDGSAIVGRDYLYAGGQLIWQANENSSKIIRIRISSPHAERGSVDSFSVTLRAPSENAVTGQAQH